MEIDIKRLARVHDISTEYLKETYVPLIEGLESKLLSEFKDLNNAEMTNGVISLIIGITGSVIGNICLANNQLDIEGLCHYVNSVVIDNVKKQMPKGSVH
jgi:hypothetical protein